ncbi:hypothetical protein P167DRAFT_562644 [Morchella conica CCBAS932]|uniref:Uncharacterized protein n=1 Tax=Morchella conica CCBAS932 TaxID=1392247 RepID=A0A3N4KYY2_9PEZI|nr:hypothetical protein P167DRAFT_562644 [Morchella conica CCBAS932]
MESLSRGRTSQFHSLHTRKLQIAHARHTLRRARLTHHQRLLTLSSIPLPPSPSSTIPTTSSTHPAIACRYTAAIHRLKRTLKAAYNQARTQHLRAIHAWEREVGDLLVCLSGPGDGRVGWVWAVEEPEEEEEVVGGGDGEYVPPLVGEEEEEEGEEGDELDQVDVGEGEEGDIYIMSIALHHETQSTPTIERDLFTTPPNPGPPNPQTTPKHHPRLSSTSNPYPITYLHITVLHHQKSPPTSSSYPDAGLCPTNRVISHDALPHHLFHFTSMYTTPASPRGREPVNSTL